jgi:hypothetical protein
MSEIEKLYELAGVEPINFAKQGAIDFTNTIEIDGKRYPDFTAEKQLEIAKFLLKKAVYYDVKDDKYWFYYEECESAGYKPFDEAIAHFINKLWTDMPEEEKQQVKGILE